MLLSTLMMEHQAHAKFWYLYMSLYVRGAHIFQKSWIQIRIIGAMKQVSCVGHKYKVQWQHDACDLCTWCGYKITRLMLDHFLFKKLHNRNVVTLNELTSPIPTLLHVNHPLLEAMLQAIF